MKSSQNKYPFLSNPDEIIGIFDLDSTTEEYTTREFLRSAEKKGILISVSRDIPRSIIVTEDFVYLSGFSSKTLHQRLEARELTNLFNNELT